MRRRAAFETENKLRQLRAIRAAAHAAENFTPRQWMLLVAYGLATPEAAARALFSPLARAVWRTERIAASIVENDA